MVSRRPRSENREEVWAREAEVADSVGVNCKTGMRIVFRGKSFDVVGGACGSECDAGEVVIKSDVSEEVFMEFLKGLETGKFSGGVAKPELRLLCEEVRCVHLIQGMETARARVIDRTGATEYRDLSIRGTGRDVIEGVFALFGRAPNANAVCNIEHLDTGEITWIAKDASYVLRDDVAVHVYDIPIDSGMPQQEHVANPPSDVFGVFSIVTNEHQCLCEEVVCSPFETEEFLQRVVTPMMENPYFVRISKVIMARDANPLIILDRVYTTSLTSLFGCCLCADQMTYTEKYACLCDIAKGIQALHAQGLYHHHLSPMNVLLDDTMHPKLINAGFADIVVKEHLDAIDTVSPWGIFYLPGSAADPIARDIYSFGVLGYCLLTGRLVGPDTIRAIQDTKEIAQEETERVILPDQVARLLSSCIALEERTVESGFQGIIEHLLLSA